MKAQKIIWDSCSTFQTGWSPLPPHGWQASRCKSRSMNLLFDLTAPSVASSPGGTKLLWQLKMKLRGFLEVDIIAFLHSPHWKSVLLVWAPGSPLTLQEPENFYQHLPEPEYLPPVNLAACPEVISLFWMINLESDKRAWISENVNLDPSHLQATMSLQPPLPMSAPNASNNHSVNSDTSHELDFEASRVWIMWKIPRRKKCQKEI